MSDFFLADDLSGALDAAAAFHHAGRRVTVVLSTAAWPEDDCDLVGLTTETRNSSAARAAATVAGAIAFGCARGGRLLYKKIDSTLRGPVAAEIAALAATLPGKRILFTPANPSVGRTVRKGVLRVNGVPVSETEFARDPVSPVTVSNLQQLLGDAGGAHVVIADAETEADLAAAVARMDADGGDWVAVGSGALARPVASRTPRVESSRERSRLVGPAGPILMICGSAHARNRSQAAVLALERGVPVHEFRPSDPAPALAALIASLRAGGGASLVVEETRGDSAAVRQAVAEAVKEIVDQTGTARAFVTGGETAFALCGILGVARLDFADELEPGLSLSRAASNRGPMLFAIKPGGFGTAETWVRAWDRLHDEN